MPWAFSSHFVPRRSNLAPPSLALPSALLPFASFLISVTLAIHTSILPNLAPKSSTHTHAYTQHTPTACPRILDSGFRVLRLKPEMITTHELMNS
ncbi:hypothetical protein BOTBODRAFT_58401 [Botryobasidium botryosum FD-172 SS1]|uniref:Uncharacterized protein n=1 Tax=Botryobasidium botryosum (strain FD-172 SS1) TaxID=930990 RepID=A0A067M293_BOTB1|nr:hypothetical protein BOTBODRAFT_58401 [Botryobasidium botryosum FD-172 SS1]